MLHWLNNCNFSLSCEEIRSCWTATESSQSSAFVQVAIFFSFLILSAIKRVFSTTNQCNTTVYLEFTFVLLPLLSQREDFAKWSLLFVFFLWVEYARQLGHVRAISSKNDRVFSRETREEVLRRADCIFYGHTCALCAKSKRFLLTRNCIAHNELSVIARTFCLKQLKNSNAFFQFLWTSVAFWMGSCSNNVLKRSFSISGFVPWPVVFKSLILRPSLKKESSKSPLNDWQMIDFFHVSFLHTLHEMTTPNDIFFLFIRFWKSVSF